MNLKFVPRYRYNDTNFRFGSLVASNVASGRLRFTTDLSEGVKDADAVFAVVSFPEFLREGAAIDDFKRPPASSSVATTRAGWRSCWPKGWAASPHGIKTSKLKIEMNGRAL